MNFYFYYLWSEIMSQTISGFFLEWGGGWLIAFFPVSHYMVILFSCNILWALEKKKYMAFWVKAKVLKMICKPLYDLAHHYLSYLMYHTPPQLLHILLLCQICSLSGHCICYFLCLEHSLLGIHVVSLSPSSNFHSHVTVVSHFF